MYTTICRLAVCVYVCANTGKPKQHGILLTYNGGPPLRCYLWCVGTSVAPHEGLRICVVQTGKRCGQDRGTFGAAVLGTALNDPEPKLSRQHLKRMAIRVLGSCQRRRQSHDPGEPPTQGPHLCGLGSGKLDQVQRALLFSLYTTVLARSNFSLVLQIKLSSGEMGHMVTNL